MAEWKEIRANLNDPGQALSSVSSTLSNVGDVFGKMRANIQADRRAQLEADLKERELAERIRQFDLNLNEDTRRFNSSHSLDTRKQDYTETSGDRAFWAGREDEGYDRRQKLIDQQLKAGETEDRVYGTTKDLLGLGTSNRSSQTGSASGTGISSTRDFSDLIKKNSFEYGVPEYIINSVANIESSGNPNAKSPTGVEGLMQVTKDTIKAMGFDPNDRTNPETSIGAGTKYLGKLFSQYGNWQDALVAYNGGDGAVQYMKTGQADPKWIEALRKAGVTDIPGKLREVQNYAQKAGQISQEFEAQGGMNAFNMARQDTIRQQNDTARFMAERDNALASLQETINSPYATPDRRIDAQARYNQLLAQTPSNENPVIAQQGNLVSNTTNSANTGSPLLGLTNTYQDEINSIVANGDSPSGTLIDRAAKRDMEIAKEEATERERLENNSMGVQFVSDFDGNVSRAYDAYEDWYSQTRGKKPEYHPLEGLKRAEEKDIAWRKAIEEGDRKAIDAAQKGHADFYKEFMQKFVDSDSNFSYDDNLTRAAMSPVFGNDPSKLDAVRGLLARAIYVDNTGDKSGWIFNGRDDKFTTTWNQIGDTVAPALEALANYDPDRTSVQDLPPLAQRVLKDAVTYGFLDKKQADALALRTDDRAQAVESERQRKAITKSSPKPQSEDDRYKALVDKLDQDTSRMADIGLISGLASIPRGGKAPKTSDVIQERWTSLTHAQRIDEKHKGRKLTNQEVLLFGTDTNERLKMFEDKISSLRGTDNRLSHRQAAEKALKWMKEQFQ